MNILEKIYNGDYIPSEFPEKIPFSLRMGRTAFFDAIEEAMGKDFLEKHWETLCKTEELHDYANFREGFRLGVSLMLELR